MTHSTQMVALTRRPSQAWPALKDLDAYFFPYCPMGTVFCERTSEAIDVRIIVQVCRGVSWKLGAGVAVLGIATDEKGRFWAGLFDGGGPPCFEHNRLTGPSDIAAKPARRTEIDRLCGYFGGSMRRKAVEAALSVPRLFRSANRRHSLAQALGLPDWLQGAGYSRIVAETVPPEAGAPRRPPRCVRELRYVEDPFRGLEDQDFLAQFQHACRRAFAFLTEEFGFEDLGQLPEVPHDEPPGNVLRIGDYTAPSPYLVCYRNRYMIVLIEYVFKEAMTRLFLIDRAGRHLDLKPVIESCAPDLLDMCALAVPNEVIPLYAEALMLCADVLTGDQLLPTTEFKPGFSFSAFMNAAEADHVLACCRPVL